MVERRGRKGKGKFSSKLPTSTSASFPSFPSPFRLPPSLPRIHASSTTSILFSRRGAEEEPPANRPRQHLFDDLFNSEDSDLILRSSDGKSFAVKRLPLQVSSDLFETMLSRPQPEREGRVTGREGLDVVEMAETSATSKNALRFVPFPLLKSDHPSSTKSLLRSLDRFIYKDQYLIDGVAPQLDNPTRSTMFSVSSRSSTSPSSPPSVNSTSQGSPTTCATSLLHSLASTVTSP